MYRVATRERGIALLTVLGIIVTMFGATASVVMVLSVRARAMTDTANETGAFYLAEAGLESSKYEIARAFDAAGDGVGNVTTETAIGRYTVRAEDLGGNTWRLNSSGVQRDREITIEAVVGKSTSTRFPAAAATLLGDYDASNFKFQTGSNVLIDGGNVPAFAVGSTALYRELGADLATDVATGSLAPESIVGSNLNSFMPERGGDEPVDLSLQLYEHYSDSLQDLTGLYRDAVSTLYDNIIPTADTVSTGPTLSSDLVYGTEDSSATVYLSSGVDLMETGSISGHGTLVIDDSVNLHPGSSITWEGDVIVAGQNADITVNGGTLDVTGNLILLGSGSDQSDHTVLAVDNLGSVQVDGSFLISTSFAEGENSMVSLSVNHGDLSVHGLFTLLGGDFNLNFQEGSQVTIDGMWQSAAPPVTSARRSRARLTTHGDLQIVYNQQNLDNGVGALQGLGTTYDLPIETLLSEDLEFYSWQIVGTQKSS